MIAPLRRRHRWMFGVLTPAVLAVMFLALAQRPPSPRSVPPEALLGISQAPSGEVLMDQGDFFASPPVAARLVRHASSLTLELEPTEPLRQPSVLAYWRPSAAGGLDSASLLGQLLDDRRQAFELPGGGGEVVLYSLAHQQELAAAGLPEVDLPADETPAIDGAVEEGETEAGETEADS